MDNPVWNARSAFAAAAPQEPAPGSSFRIERFDDASIMRLSPRPGLEPVLGLLVRNRYGIVLPVGPGFAAHDGVAFIRIAPEAWMVVGVEPASLERALGTAASLFDWSDSRALLRLSGFHVRDVLAKLLPIDLHPRVFGPGNAVTSRIGQIGATLWQIDAAPRYMLAVPRSYAGDALRWLLKAGAEYGAALD